MCSITLALSVGFVTKVFASFSINIPQFHLSMSDIIFSYVVSLSAKYSDICHAFLLIQHFQVSQFLIISDSQSVLYYLYCFQSF